MTDKDGLSKNLQVAAEQWADYRAECRVISKRIWQALRQGNVIPGRKGNIWHIAHGYVEESFDLMPRLWSYLFWPLVAAFILLAIH